MAADLGVLEGANDGVQNAQTKQEAEVTDAVDDEGFATCTGVLVLLVPKTNQQVAGQSNALPADKGHRQRVAQDQDQHRASKQV